MHAHPARHFLATVALAAAFSGVACKGKKSSPAEAVPPPEPPAAPISALEVKAVNADLSVPDPAAPYWKDVARGQISLLAQPMVTPRPEATTTEQLVVAAVHNTTHIAFRLSWADSERSEAGRLGEYSDAAAIQFPVGDMAKTPPMMGGPELPVHIFHWRAQYQRDAEEGKPEMTALYPNMSVDMYPMEFKEAPGGTPEQREGFSPGRAEGNPQSYQKHGVDEIIAEGFATSAVQEGQSAAARAEWRDGRWTLVITRPLAIEGGSTLAVGQETGVAFAVWQGGKAEVGSRKSVLMAWLPTRVL
ncbi:MAG: hypothetical protein K8M05_20905 [Deltaproteobacteria bacterium]|nr:hypothetical protein [Kofleriaceae bacterium]